MIEKMKYQFYTADVFTDKPFSGNQLAVFPDAQGLDDITMQKIAAEFNFSETVFVFPSSTMNVHRKLRIFTPSAEIPFAGHPTIGTAFILTKIGYIPLEKTEFDLIFEEGGRKVPVKVKSVDNQTVYAELKALSAPEFHNHTPPLSDLTKVLSLSEKDLILEDYQVQAVSCGLPFLFIPLRNIKSLQKAKINQPVWENVLSNFWSPHVYIFCATENNKWRARMFAPALGIKEDPATGSAAAAFAAYLANRENKINGSWQWTIEQGIEMGRPSLLQAHADKENGTIKEIRVGGACVLVSKGNLTCLV
jgi:trans-2,3-dihydro-3-hydroxyanthranilate isomerase